MDADKESSEKKNAEEEDLKEVRADTETPEEKESENMDETETVVDPDDPSVVYSMPEKKNNPSLFEKAGNAAGSLFDAAKAKTKLFIEEAAKMSESDIQEGLGRTVIKDFIDFEETGTAAYTYRQILKDQKSDITSMLPVSLPIQTEDGEQSMAVTWECDDDVIHTEYDEYTFYPKWNDSYVLSAELQKQYDDAEITLPFVTVKILPSVTAPIDEKTSNTSIDFSLNELSDTIGNMKITPGVRMVLSDVGDASFTLQSILIVNGGTVLLDDAIVRRHNVVLSAEEMVADYETKAYPKLIQIMETLRNLESIRVKEKGKAVKELLAKIKFRAAFGNTYAAKYRELYISVIKNEPTSGIDVVLEILKIPGNIQSKFCTSTEEKVALAVGQVLMMDIERILLKW